MIYQHDLPLALGHAAYRRAWDRRIRSARPHDGQYNPRDLHPDYDWEVALVAVDAGRHRADAFRVRARAAKAHPRPWPPEFEDAE